jgi:phosphoribosylanthranilate isomerase
MCGTTGIEDAQMAVSLGVDALGFIFVGKSPRYISPEDALEITQSIPPFVAKIGVFVDSSHQDIEEIVHYLGLNGVQLHGAESPAYCEKTALTMPSCTILKAIRVGKHTGISDFSPYNDCVKGFVLDTYVENMEGGTGLAFDWNILRALEIQRPCILAGGLNPDNIGRALEIAAPFAVDVNSGVEDAPGRKNHDLLRRFVGNVVEFDRLRSPINEPQ